MPTSVGEGRIVRREALAPQLSIDQSEHVVRATFRCVCWLLVAEEQVGIRLRSPHSMRPIGVLGSDHSVVLFLSF